jgi:hypothetical protein
MTAAETAPGHPALCPAISVVCGWAEAGVGCLTKSD